MGLPRRLAVAVLDPVASRPRVLVGALLVLAGTGHFTAWTRGTDAAVLAALAAGNATAAGGALAAYATSHPAYLAAVLAGVAVAASRR